MTAQEALTIIETLRVEIQRAIVGQEQIIEQVLIALLAGGHVLLEGVPGLGKTLLVQALARSFAGKARRIQFTPDLMPSDITGHAMYDMQSEQFKIRRGPVFTNLLLADEINRAPAKTQAALLEVMQEQQVSIEGKAFNVDSPFMTLATQNPIEQEGTYPLPEAQLDRFLLKITIDYPNEYEEIRLIRQVTIGKIGEGLDVSKVGQVISPAEVLAMQKVVSELRVEDQIYEYATKIVRATRNWSGVSVGVGPRGGIALIRAARALALLQGRDYVIPHDIKQVALATLRHRLRLTPELEIEGYDNDRVLIAILDTIPAPR
jgi:MoxR-like ATPase